MKKTHGNQRQVLTTDKEKVAYFAGILDGEGCIDARVIPATKQGYNQMLIRIVLTNTDWRLLSWIVENFGGKLRLKSKRETQYKTIWEWSCKHEYVVKLLHLVMPYLIVKREEAELALRLRATVKPGRKEKDWAYRKMLSDQIKALKRRQWTAAETKPEDSAARRSDSPLPDENQGNLFVPQASSPVIH